VRAAQAGEAAGAGEGDREKRRGLLRPGGDPVTVFGFIAAEKANHPISVMCSMLGVSRSGFMPGSTARRQTVSCQTRG